MVKDVPMRVRPLLSPGLAIDLNLGTLISLSAILALPTLIDGIAGQPYRRTRNAAASHGRAEIDLGVGEISNLVEVMATTARRRSGVCREGRRCLGNSPATKTIKTVRSLSRTRIPETPRGALNRTSPASRKQYAMR
jgi:hypothetical protein